MFAVQDTSKRKFQKPNILRRRAKPKTPKQNSPQKCNSANVQSLVDYSMPESQIQSSAFDMDSTDTQCILQDTQFNISDESLENQKWCLNFVDDEQEIVIEDFDGSQLGSLRIAQDPSLISVPLNSISLSSNSEVSPASENSTASPTQNVSTDYLTSTMIYKCDEPGCGKRFRNAQRLTKHKESHNPDSSMKLSRQTSVECPVKKTIDGEEVPCNRIFPTKKALLLHLNEDHSPEDASFVCEVCSRRFFWAVGLRAHGRAHWGPAPLLPCSWPGCGRVFRQPCRLREHTRAHTGDKPYPCAFPGCEWSFRTASKLLRHARRHTGERRYACPVCGMAFRRPEHMRDHAARLHRKKCRCPHAGCTRMFASAPGLQAHLRRAHGDQTVVSADLFDWSIQQESPGSDSEGRDGSPVMDVKSLMTGDADETTDLMERVDAMGAVDAAGLDMDLSGAGMGIEAAIELEAVEGIETGVAIEAVEGIDAGVAIQAVEGIEAGVAIEAVEGIEAVDGIEAGVAIEAVEGMEAGVAIEAVEGIEAGVETNLRIKSEAGIGLGVDIEGLDVHEARAARTHCTWPLEREPPAPPTPPPTLEDPDAGLEEDFQVEVTEGSETNVYTIRSDLFLHGNVLNEDSEHMGGSGSLLLVPQTDSDLGLLDTHPTIDLMQEELMYTDSAVDESSFRVFLLSGEELV